MTDKAFIIKRGSGRDESTFASENEVAQKFGFVPLLSYEHGTIIDGGSPDEYRKLEKEGYRVKSIPKAEILDIGEFYIDTDKGLPEVPSEFKIPDSLKDSWPHYIVKLITRPIQQWIKEIESKGVKVLETISQNFLFVVGTRQNVEALRNYTYVEDIFPFEPAYRLNKNLHGIKGKISYLRVDFYPRSEIESIKKVIQELGGTIIQQSSSTQGSSSIYGKLIVETDSKYLPNIARIPQVRSLEFASKEPGLDGERETQILANNLNNFKPVPGYKPWLTQLGLSGNGITIAVCDSGIDLNADNNTSGHPDVRGRQLAFVDYTDGENKTDIVGHGTHVAGICVGNAASGMTESGTESFLWGQGVAPDAKYVNQNAIMLRPWPPSEWARFTRDAVQNGAQIITNSWWDGGQAGSGYTASARRWDMLCRDPSGSSLPGQQHVCIVFSAGNAGNKPYTLTPPHEAKNLVIVGNSLTFRPGVNDRDPRSGELIPDDITGINRSSSRGPAIDGRILPTIVAPGTSVSSALSSTAPPEWESLIVPNTDRKYVYLTGTSMAAPHVAGTCALFMELWKKRSGGKIPSLALIKAALVNSAVDLAGGPSGRLDQNKQQIPIDHIPNTDQGWGRVDLTNLLKIPKSDGAESRIFVDQESPFTSSGQEHVIRVVSKDKSRPLKVTLTYTDAPGALNAQPALVNDLDLEVQEISSGDIYKGNVFKDGFSIPGGDYDNINNVECIYIKTPSGQYDIRIIASNIEADARPPFEKTTPWQDYAVVIDNATRA